MKKVIQWFKDSNRSQHLGLGILCGALANDWYCTIYGAVGTAGALELKDYLWGGKPDVIDFALTVVGFSIGFSIRCLVWK